MLVAVLDLLHTYKVSFAEGIGHRSAPGDCEGCAVKSFLSSLRLSPNRDATTVLVLS